MLSRLRTPLPTGITRGLSTAPQHTTSINPVSNPVSNPALPALSSTRVWGSALLAISLFALTVPMTSTALEGWSTLSIGSGRGVIGGAIAILAIQFSGWKWPDRHSLLWLALATPGLVFGFPYLLTYALQDASSADLGVVLAALPLLTAIFSAILSRQNLPRRFWGWAIAGMLVSYGYFLLQSDWALQGQSQSTQLVMLVALLSSSWGYAAGAKAARTLGGWQTVCWMQALSAPLSAILFGYSLGQPEYTLGLPQAEALLALLYLGVFSQLIGFRFWFQALAVDTARVSQIQLLQPLITLTALVLFWNASINLCQWLAALAILLCVVGAVRTKETSTT